MCLQPTYDTYMFTNKCCDCDLDNIKVN